MRVEVNGVRIFFDVEGAKLIPDGPTMRERPTLILLHGGPGMDHSSYKPAFSQYADIIAAALPAHLVRFERFAGAGHGAFRDDPSGYDVIREFILS